MYFYNYNDYIAANEINGASLVFTIKIKTGHSHGLYWY